MTKENANVGANEHKSGSLYIDHIAVIEKHQKIDYNWSKSTTHYSKKNKMYKKRC